MTEDGKSYITCQHLTNIVLYYLSYCTLDNAYRMANALLLRCSCMANANLHASLLQCRYHGNAQSPKCTYSSGLTKFQSFCNHYKLTVLPAWLCNTSICTRLNTYLTTIKVYLATICLRHIEQGFFYDPTTYNWYAEAFVASKVISNAYDNRSPSISFIGWRRSSVSLHTPSQRNSCCG